MSLAPYPVHLHSQWLSAPWKAILLPLCRGWLAPTVVLRQSNALSLSSEEGNVV